ncbi:hypothetical protein [Sphingosinicella terrae]|uniref:hypothetical protein n=1 Tax=Sphingosinicella terrae TaxID=2172047 RepID=UPI002546EBD6|nr:hypothetical protein [Sphingosinicella terrae]
MRTLTISMAFAAMMFAVQPLEAQGVPAAPTLTYADLADLALAAPVVAHVRVERSDALSERETSGVPAGHRRFLIEASVVALIRGTGGLPPRVSYLVDLPNDSRGRAQRIRRRTEYLVFASRVPNRPAELRLAAPDAQLPASPELAERLRGILRDSIAPDAAPAIVGIGRAFHVPGSLPGESETQIFLLASDDRPISLSVLRRPGEQPRWSVALGEMVDNAAAAPQPETLLWYRLACTLPRELPAQSVSEATPQEAQAIRADYRLVMEGLGTCTRSRIPR